MMTSHENQEFDGFPFNETNRKVTKQKYGFFFSNTVPVTSALRKFIRNIIIYQYTSSIQCCESNIASCFCFKSIFCRLRISNDLGHLVLSFALLDLSRFDIKIDQRNAINTCLTWFSDTWIINEILDMYTNCLLPSRDHFSFLLFINLSSRRSERH